MCSIEEAINGLYETFSRYPRPAVIKCCPCGCTTPEAGSLLLACSLRELRFLDLADYSFRAMTTQGSVNDFRYFLPRLLQGIVEETYSYPVEILFHKLSYARWATWQEDEQIVVKRYLSALLQVGLTSFPIEERLPAFFEIETVLSSIAQTGEYLDPYLDEWTKTKVRASEEHLIQFVTMYGGDLANGMTFSDGFWRDARKQAQEVRQWLLKPETLQRIKDGQHLLRRDGFEHLFTPALNALQVEADAAI